ncbi:50S ribosomal protein L20 [Oenococcus oeni]|uniref:Large ribosomal subunit protein bL20 n=2 Tax=Oenococcus oeni TaxID=1247 RepID=RL20_OENOB|nr:RecName: Full=Large ribosomal subunit protein bL20; AltName: Full=50S ribosomal protein L20 [Oenococcus oeni PSU-1]OIK67905.1 50S ribosomal protein L20 [Oenococcus oeni]ABJ57151.1 LSU ribosomal protein L20P [Oenococcus oeni PSU-1]OIL14280.1 50S ribosomal protein L20 [Oenococcus oeni]OIL28097.1 50S ribosomal protein L20 [Oenococcus oeni]OIL81121.1 50S ribosomal protein L20 [Oenococcus oeni]
MRVKGTNVTRIRRKKMIKLAKGYRGQRHINFKVAKQQVWKSYLYAYRDRKNVKRDYRKLWIARINAASRKNGISYSQLMHGFKVAGIDLNRKMLAELAVSDFATFSKLAETAKKQVSAPTRKAATLDTDIKIERIEKGAAKPVVLEPGKSTKTQEVAVAEKPTTASTVAEIKAYLDSESIKYPSSAKKADLLALVK